MSDYQLYTAHVTLLTPLHIGSGVDLLHEYDYAIYQKRTWRLNENVLLDAQDLEDPRLVEQLARTPPARLLKASDYQEQSKLFRYIIQGTPRSRGEGAQVQEQIKDVYDRPYLPGSSFKGALRTALAWVGWKEKGLRPERTRLKRYPQFAAQNYEQALFGRDPNHDLLRALQIGDSEPIDTDRLMLANAQVLHRNGKQASPIEMEALKPDTTFTLPIKIDLALLSEWAGHDQLGPATWLQELPQRVQQHTARRLETERTWFDGVDGAEAIRDFYRQLPARGLPPHIFLMQVGWGTGWDDKTLDGHLREDQRFLEGILRPHREGGYGIVRSRGRRRPGEPFPKSRRVLVQVMVGPDRQRAERPRSPLGWVLVEMQEN